MSRLSLDPLESALTIGQSRHLAARGLLRLELTSPLLLVALVIQLQESIHNFHPRDRPYRETHPLWGIGEVVGQREIAPPVRSSDLLVELSMKPAEFQYIRRFLPRIVDSVVGLRKPLAPFEHHRP